MDINLQKLSCHMYVYLQVIQDKEKWETQKDSYKIADIFLIQF